MFSKHNVNENKLRINTDFIHYRTLAGMFPNLDRDLIDDVVTMKEGR